MLIVFVTQDSILVFIIASFGKLGYKVPLILNLQELAQIVKIIGDELSVIIYWLVCKAKAKG